TLPAEVGIDSQTTGLGAVVAAQIEHRLVVVDPRRARRELVLGEIEPGFTRGLSRAEQHRRHIVTVEDDGFALAIVLRELCAAERGKRRHEVEAPYDFGVLAAGLDFRAPGDGRNAVTAFSHGALGATERRVSGIR